MTKLLKWLILFLGLVIVSIGAAIAGLGPQTVGDFFAEVVSMMYSVPPVVDGLNDPNTDSELRFYSIVFLACGCLIIWIGANIEDHMHLVPLPAVIFFLGGLARLVSVNQVGWPHPVFTGLMIIELVVPILIIAIWLVARGRTTHS